MRYLLSNHPQGTDAWKADRAGKITGSKAAAILAQGRKKGEESTTRRNYRFQLVCERLTGKIQEDTFTNKHIERGNALEPFARMAYEIETCEVVKEAGFAYLPDLQAGCSVDGFVGNGFVEFKCPIPAIHFAYMQCETAPAEYMPQIMHNLWITGADFCDFASYCEEMPEKLRLFRVRVERDEKAVKEYEADALNFLCEVAALEDDMRKRAA